MLELARTVRFGIPLAALRPGGPSAVPGPDAPDVERGRWNTFAGWPSPDGVGLFVEWCVRCRGSEDPATGYLIGIGEIDAAVREVAIDRLARRLAVDPGAPPARLLADLMEPVADRLEGRLHAITWALTPFLRVTLEYGRMDRFETRHQFDFAAAHHLRSASLDDAANERTYGKCSNPHGHNYRVEVAVSQPTPAPGEAAVLGVPALERIVDGAIIETMDHRDLNELEPLFAGRLPSVENIARVCHEQLAGPIEAAGAELVSVTVWETEKTSCTYPAPAVRAARPREAAGETAHAG